MMYDRETESLWSQVLNRAVAGPLSGTGLEKMGSTLTSWGKWKKKYPATRVATFNTGHRRDYSEDPYADYYQSRRSLFSRFFGGPGEEDKELVVGVEGEGFKKAYPLKLLRDKKKISDKVGDVELLLEYDTSTDSVTARVGGEERVVLIVYWFVWRSVHPATTRYGE